MDWTALAEGGVVFMNPPWGRDIDKFIKKAYEESLKGLTVVCVIPTSTDTKYWTNYVSKSSEVRLFEGRLHYVREDGHTGPCTKGSAIVIFQKKSDTDSLPKYSTILKDHLNEFDVDDTPQRKRIKNEVHPAIPDFGGGSKLNAGNLSNEIIDLSAYNFQDMFNTVENSSDGGGGKTDAVEENPLTKELIGKMMIAELRDRCSKLGLPTQGVSKANLKVQLIDSLSVSEPKNETDASTNDIELEDAFSEVELEDYSATCTHCSCVTDLVYNKHTGETICKDGCEEMDPETGSDDECPSSD